MSIEVLQMMSKVFWILAVFFSCVVLLVFFWFRIGRIIVDMSGIRKRHELQVISQLKIAEENISQEILGMSLLQEEKTETFAYTEDTGVLELESVKGIYRLKEKMEYIGSEKWIE